MSKLYFHSEYTKDIKHVLNYLVYAGEKLEAQEVILNTGETVNINADEFIDFSKHENVKGVEIHTKDGRNVFFNPEEYIRLIKQDKEIEHLSPKGYIDYIAERPGAVKDEVGGLFTINGSISTDEALNIAEQYPNNTWWINIISLKRSDAERVGFDNRESFEDLICSKIPDICKNYNISFENLIIYGAYHDKINNPHVHLFFTSKDNREGFVKDLKNSSLKMKSNYFNTIYKDDMKILYQEKDTHKKELNTALENSIKRLSAKSYITENQVLQSFVDLSNALKTEKGKLQYGYLSKENKRLVDTLLIDIINRDKEVNKCFKECLNTQEKFLKNYTSSKETIKEKLDDYKVRLLMPYSKQKDNVLQNIIIKNISTYNQTNTIKKVSEVNKNDFIMLSNNDPKFMYQLGKNLLYKENNPLDAEEYLFKSYMMNHDRYTAFELGQTMLKLNNKERARHYFDEFITKVQIDKVSFPYEFYILSKYYKFEKNDFRDMNRYSFMGNDTLNLLTDEFMNKKEQELALQEYLNLKVSANLGYIPAIQKTNEIKPIKLTENITFDYSVHNNNPYIISELKELLKNSNIYTKDYEIYTLSQNIIDKLTYNEEKNKYKTKFRFNEKLILAKSYLDLYNTSKEVYLSKNIFDTENQYIDFCNISYDKFLDTIQNILKTDGYLDEKLNLSVYLLKNNEADVSQLIMKNILKEDVKLNPTTIINIYQKEDIYIKKEILTQLSNNNIQAMYFLGKDYFYSNSKEEKQKGIELLEKAVSKGHLYSTLILGNYYLSSDDKNLTQKGIDLLSPLVEHNNEQSIYYLGKHYLYSEDEQDIKKGISLLEKNISKEHHYSKLLIANYYISNNNSLGYKYLNELKQSDIEFFNVSAKRISSNIDFKSNNLTSAEIDLKDVCNSNYVTNMDIYNLGHIYDKLGNEISANKYYKEALNNFKLENSPTSNYMLGIMYLTGRGCEKDTSVAKEYFNLANKQGHPQAKEMISSINKQTIYACNHLLQAIAYNLMSIANENYDYNQNLNKHKSKNNFRKPKVYRVSKLQENIQEKTKSHNKQNDYTFEY